MKGIRFYEEYINTTKKQSQRNVVAAFVGNGVYYSNKVACYDALTAVHSFPDSPVCSGGVALEYLESRCKRVSEARAREIHPALFERLDEEE